MILDWVKNYAQEIKNYVVDTSFDDLVWLVNIVPNLAGFSIHNDKVHAAFWIIHLSLLLYVYGAGCAMYQIKFATGVEDFVKSYVNVSLLILISNISWWWLMKRPILRAVLKKMEESDRLARSSETLRKKYKRHLRIIKIIIMIFYMTQLMDATLIYIPHRVNVHGDYCMVPCVGLDPVDSTPYKQICMIILAAQELTIMSCVLNYQALLVFLIAHTATMFHMLTQEMMAFNHYSDLKEHKAYVKERLSTLIRRHALTLEVFSNLKLLYSVPIGVDFGSNAVCISLFFYMSFKEWLKFMPVVVYCFMVFFMYCFLCQNMTNASENFERAVYSCGWENFDMKERKLLYVMLIQSQKPVVLLAADIVPVNMYTFATTLQFMFKFLAVVNTKV